MRGGAGGGGATLTPQGREVLSRFRQIEAAARNAASADMAAALNGMVLPNATGNRALLDGASPGLVRTAQQLAQTMHQHGLLARIPDTTGLVDGRFVREMQP